MIRDEDAALTGYVYIDLNTKDYGGFVERADKLLRDKLALPAGYSFKWSGEYEFELRAKERLKIILPVVFFVIFLLLYMVFHSVAEAIVLIFPTIYAMSGGLLLQWWLGYNFSVAVWVGYIALFGIAVETGVVMVVYLHEALDQKLLAGPVTNADIHDAAIEGAVHRLRPKADDRIRGSRQPCADPLGIRGRLGCDETDCGADCGGHDHLHDSRTDSGAGVFCADEKPRVAARQPKLQ